MPELILGRAGSGKTRRIIDGILTDLRAGKRVLLLVPEQQTLSAEHAVNAACVSAGVPMAELEVLNFTRLANRVFREYGGLSYRYATSGARAVLMWLTLCSLSDALCLYGGVHAEDAGTVALLVSACENLKRYRVTPERLSEAADALEADGHYVRLSQKLHDLSLIASGFDAAIHEKYTDPGDDLTRLDALLDDHPFFAGRQVYLDSFFGFTPDQFAVIRQILRTADGVTVAFPLPEERGMGTFGALEYTLRRLRRLSCDCGTPFSETVLTDAPSACAPRLRELEKAFWDTSVQGAVSAGVDPSLTLYEARTLYEECDRIAADIAVRVRGGARFRDFSVVTRDPVRYDGIVQISFARYGVPFFFAVPRPLHAQPPVRLILYALNIIGRGWRCEDVLSYVKTGLCPLEEEEIDLLEGYVTTWEPSGSAWWDNDAWCMSPDGYSDRPMREEAAERLRRLRQIRARVADPLRAVGEELSGGVRVLDACGALYRFLCENGFYERMQAASPEGTPVWNAVMDALDILVDCAGEATVTVPVLRQLLMLVFGSIDLGRIPSGVDTVAIGSAATMRTDGVRHVYLMGMNEGIFPAPPKKGGLFDDSELAALETYEVELAPRDEQVAAQEQYHVYRALCSAPDGVHISYAAAQPDGSAMLPSSAVVRILTLFPDTPILHESDIPVYHRALTAESALELAAREQSSQTGRTLSEALRRVGMDERRLAAVHEPLTVRNASIARETSAHVHGDRMSLTKSRIDCFEKCPMSYLGAYVLRIRHEANRRFGSADQGNYIHRVLELVLRQYQSEGRLHAVIPDGEIEARVQAVSLRYFEMALPSEAYRTARMRRLFRRMNDTACLLLHDIMEEFRNSDFEPAGFELKIGESADASIVPTEISLPDGSCAVVRGAIDRLDVCRCDEGTYVRVVDYKTGGKTLRADAAETGQNPELFLYLFAAVHGMKAETRRALAVPPDAPLIPAAAFYYDAGAPRVESTETAGEAARREAIVRAPSRSGVSLNDPAFLMHANHAGDSHFTGMKRNGSNGLDTERMEQFEQAVYAAVSEKAYAMRQGCASSRPSEGPTGACTYCDMRPVCRNYKIYRGENATETEVNENG